MEKTILQYRGLAAVYCIARGGRLGWALGVGRWVGRAGRAGGARRQDERGVRRERRQNPRGARGAGRRRVACAHLGVLLGQQGVHLVHSACFDPVLTQYCS